MNFEKPEKSEFWKKENKLQEISSFYTCVPKTTIIWGTVPEIRSGPKNFCHFGPFFALYPPPPPPILPNNLEDQNFEKMKSIWSCHHFKLVQQKTHSNGVCLQRYEVVWQTKFFVILGHFLLFYPTIDPEN